MSDSAGDSEPRTIPLPVRSKGTDPCAKMYGQIAKVHKELVEAKWRARTAGQPFQLRPEILLHLEESVTFLAEELLKLRKSVDDLEAVSRGLLGGKLSEMQEMAKEEEVEP